MGLIALRAMQIGGRWFGPGDDVPRAELTPAKIGQMVALRRLLDTDVSHEQTYRAMRSFVVRGEKVVRDDLLPASLLDPAKLSQLLEHRYLEPAFVAAEPPPAPVPDEKPKPEKPKPDQRQPKRS